MSVGQELRTVGQGLESLGVEDFDLKSEGEGYFVLGIPRDRKRSAQTDRVESRAWTSRVYGAWRDLTGQSPLDRKTSEPGPDVLRILFTPEGLLRLEVAGIVKRNPESPGVPDPARLGQILRMVGEELDAQSGRLLEVRKRRRWISFDYSTDSDAHVAEEWKISELVEHWLEAFRKRRERAEIVERELIRRERASRAGAQR